MKKIILPFIFILMGCKDKSTPQDKEIAAFKTLCSLASNFDWSQEIEKSSLNLKFSDFLETKIPNTQALQAVKALVSFQESTAGERYQMLESGAKEIGASNFDCPILKENF